MNRHKRSELERITGEMLEVPRVLGELIDPLLIQAKRAHRKQKNQKQKRQMLREEWQGEER